MTTPTPEELQLLSRINPSPTIHNPPQEVPSVRRLTSKQVGVIGTVIVDLILAQVALALGGIQILGQKPFGFLTTWGQQIQIKAADAFNKAMAAEAVANSADANQAIALGQVVVTKDQLQQTSLGLQTTWNGLWEASTNTVLPPGQNKGAADVKNGQIVVREIAVQGASGASGAAVNIQGTWNNIYNGAFQTSVSTASLSDVFNTNRVIAIRAGTSDTNQGILGGNIQKTWDSIYVAAGGTGPSTNRSLSDAQARLLALNNTAYGASGNIYATWDQYYFNWYGFVPPEPSEEDVGQVTKEISETVTDLGERVERIETTENTSVFSGNGISVAFSEYTPGALPNPPWTVSYPTISGGFGSNTITVNADRRVAFTAGGNMKRRAVAIHNTQLKTTFPKVSVSLAGWPQQGASNWIYGRSNSTGTTAVAARIYVNTFLFFFNTSHTVELYSISGGTATLFADTTTSLAKSTSTWTLECGTTSTGAGPNTFRVLCDGRQVMSATNNSAANGGNYVGFGIESLNGLTGYLPPAPVTSFNAYDNTPASYLGAGYRASRTSGDVSLPNSSNNPAVLPTNAFSVEDIAASGSLEKVSSTEIRAKVGGWYAVTVSLNVSSLNVRPAVYVNDSCKGIGIYANPSAETFLVYAATNDVIKAGYTAGAGLTLTGEGGGFGTYFTVTFVGNTVPTNPSK